MAFKENLLEKMEIDRLAKNVRNTLGRPGTERKLDRDAMRQLLGRTDFHRRDERDLELYVRNGTAGPVDILVLDNDLPYYHTTVADVLMRKSPTVKEMISIKNAVKILSDKDVIQTRGEETLDRIHRQCVEALDLTFGVSDLAEIAGEGAESLDNGYADGVLESLDLFAEILGWGVPPSPLRLPHHRQIGKRTETASGGTSYGPSVLFSRSQNRLKWGTDSLDPADKGDVERLHQVADGEAEPDAEGREVFQRLVDEVGRENPDGFQGA